MEEANAVSLRQNQGNRQTIISAVLREGRHGSPHAVSPKRLAASGQQAAAGVAFCLHAMVQQGSMQGSLEILQADATLQDMLGEQW